MTMNNFQENRIVEGKLSSAMTFSIDVLRPAFRVESHKGDQKGTLQESLDYLRELGVVQPMNVSNRLSSLHIGESVILEDYRLNQIKITRIKYKEK